MKSTPSVLFLCDYFSPAIGGIEVTNLEITRRLSSSGYDITVYTQRLPHTEKEENRDGVQIIRVQSPLRSLFPIWGLWGAVKLARKADIIHVSPYSSAYLAMILMLFVHKPYVLHVHGFLGRELTQSSYSALFSWLVFAYERMMFLAPWRKIITASKNVAQRLQQEGLIKDAPEVIYNGIDSALFSKRGSTSLESDSKRQKYNLPKSAQVLLFAARPSPLKGFRAIIDALPTLLEKHNELHMVFFVPIQHTGWKDFSKQSRSLVDHPRVHIFDSVPHEHMPEIYSMSDLVLVPSSSEGFCFQAVEAASCGSVVLCPKTTVFPEVMSGKVIFIPEVSSKAIIKGVEMFLQQNWEEIPMKTFDWDASLERLTLLYQAILQERT